MSAGCHRLPSQGTGPRKFLLWLGARPTKISVTDTLQGGVQMSMFLWSKRTGLLVGLMGAYYIHSLVGITVVAGVHNQPASFMALPELSLHS